MYHFYYAITQHCIFFDYYVFNYSDLILHGFDFANCANMFYKYLIPSLTRSTTLECLSPFYTGVGNPRFHSQLYHVLSEQNRSSAKIHRMLVLIQFLEVTNFLLFH